MSATNIRSLFLCSERLLNRAVVTGAALMLVVASAAALFQVFSRFVLHVPAHWSEPMIKISLIWMVYLGLMAGARTGTMIAVDFVFDMTKGRFRTLMRAMILVAMLIVLVVLFYNGWRAVYMVRNQTIAGLGLSASWVYAAIPIGAGFAALAAIAHFIDPHTKTDSAEAL
ncbi:TRAP transporter small permease subunit [Aureimonas fodinaquatilis]|uniref:TRAP transporter small permease protein n=1 Tax=Aureimonas fodinaquatilis TaxID=2565783 RepID=A0A5B0DVK8_9HYPH|nr:TRAP transporter small permease subunit [Aureimonas fodinaquatilis]KAA0970453.1 TRAP transporter small permease subunit [Aureimonas fodinaquatilis]